ncbi:MAG TPA: class I SAM-dependent methyltransferase, partial [Spirochaetia bacterium]|nr:class I SAM-dependent methyltransferase [Spirochaetia bacterium]
MARVGPFDTYTKRYDAWFERHRHEYESELAAVRQVLPKTGRGLEIGVGGGRFAVPLGIRTGVEPSAAMRALARERGVNVEDGVAERLPFVDGAFDFVLFVTTICFVDDIDAALREAARVVTAEGSVIVGFVDKESPLGQKYITHKMDNVF